MSKIYIAVLCLLLLSCSSHKTETKKAAEVTSEELVTMTDEQVKNADMETGKPLVQPLAAQLKVNGTVDVPPQNIVSVSFPLGGYLRSTKLLPGMHVNKGEVIAAIEDQALVQLQQDYLVTAARLVYQQQEFERQKLLNENKVNADKIYQQSQAEYAAQKVMLKGYAEKLKLIGIDPSRLNENNISRSVAVHSPINGFVSKVNVNIGKYVTGTDVLFELINPDDLHAALTIFEKDIPKVMIGQKVNVSFVDDTATVYPCEVILVTQNVDESRSALVHCHFEKKPQKLLPGMFLNAVIETRTSNVVTLPEEAIVRFGNKQYVFEVTGKNNFKMVEVQTGISENNYTEIIDPPGDFQSRIFVIKNAYAVLSKMKNTAEE